MNNGFRRFLCSGGFVLALAVPQLHATGDSILGDKIAWNTVGPVRESERPMATVRIDGAPGASAKPAPELLSGVKAADGGAEFWLHGEAAEKRSMRWQGRLPAPQKPAQYYRLQYRASGITREHTAYPIVQLGGRDSNGKPRTVQLLDCAAVINDGLPHSLVGRLDNALTAEDVRVQMATENSRAWLRMDALELYADRAEIPPFDAGNTGSRQAKNEAGFVPIPLAGGDASQLNDSIAAAFDRTLDKYGAVVDGARGCPAGRLVVCGVPWVITDGAMNMIRPAERSEVNREQVEFLGAKVARVNFFRPSRDDALTVPLEGRRAAEIFFLLACEMPAVQSRYGIPSAPYRLDDIEAFAVELVYKDGTRDWAFPYSLADGGCVLARMFGACAVAADASRALEKVVFHNRLFGVTMSVAAVTLNTSARLIPALVDETPPVKTPRRAPPTPRPAHLNFRDGHLTGGNAYYEFTADCRRGFSFTRLSSGWSPDTAWKVNPSSGLEVVLARRQRTVEERNQLAGTAAQTVEVDAGKTVFTGRAFAVDQVHVTGTTATIVLRSLHAALPLEIVLRLTVDDSPQLAMNLEATNRGQSPMAATIRFPAVEGLVLGDLKNTWLFFPQYRAVVTRDEGGFAALNGPYFSHQFFDVFNPAAGVGLMTLTHNRDQFPLEYSMRKTSAGVDCGVACPGEFHVIPPGQTLRPPEVSLIFHAGDWHQAMHAYQDWLKTWYQPRQVRGDWWRSAFVMRSHIISPADSKKINRIPSIFDPSTGQYRIDEAMEADRRYWGHAPDLVHFYGWYYRDREKSLGWGEYSTPEAYAQAGGLDAMRRAIAHFQDDFHTPVSLYTIGDRCSEGTTAFGQFGEAARLWRAGAALPLIKTPTGNFTSMCWAFQPWQDHCMADLAKLRRDTGAKIIYLDVFPLQKGNACDSPTHGHEAPLWFDRTSHRVLSRLRDALSQDVAIYSEYPMSDVTAQDIDGNVAYYNLPLHRHFDKLYDVARLDERAALEAEAPFSLYRYVFPTIKQFCFAVGVEHSRSDSCLKIPFFNGDAELGVTWRLNPEHVRQITNRGLAIQHRYAACFTTDHPQPAVPTLRRGVHANCFPGPDCTLWTLWNARYQTVRGSVLAVDHHPGDRYFDAWNNRPLEPQIHGSQTVLSVELDPQGLGCVVQSR